VYKYRIEAMKRDKDMEDPVFGKRLRKKFLDRWENEGGRICTASENAPHGPSKDNSQTQSLSHYDLKEENDRPSSRKKPS
jgi:hypothetical protein